MAHLAAKLAGREHGRVETHGGGKTVAPRIQREPRAEHAQKRTVAGGGEREEFIHKSRMLAHSLRKNLLRRVHDFLARNVREPGFDLFVVQFSVVIHNV